MTALPAAAGGLSLGGVSGSVTARTFRAAAPTVWAID